MRIWHDKAELVERLADARRAAYNTAPRGSNDALEASLFLAMMAAMFPEAVNHLLDPQAESTQPPPETPPESEQSEAPVALPSPEMVSEESDLEPPPPELPAPTSEQLPENEYGESG